MAVRKAETFPPVTMGHIRGHGCRALLVYCGSGHHSATMNADWLPHEPPVRSLCRRMVCTRCGMIGADVRPDWSPRADRRPRLEYSWATERFGQTKGGPLRPALSILRVSFT